jgi:hypothetical protein
MKNDEGYTLFSAKRALKQVDTPDFTLKLLSHTS